MKKVIAITLLFALIATLVPATAPVYAAATTTKATPTYAVALSYPYNFTLSVQDGKLVLSGISPSYGGNYADNPKLIVDLIKPINYGSCTIGSDGIASVATDIAKTIKSALDEIGPLSNVPGYASLDRNVTNFVNALLKRNPDLDREATTTLLYNLLHMKVDLGSSTSIVQGILDNCPKLDLTVSSFVHLMLEAAPKTATVVKTVTHTLNPDSSAMAPVIPVTDSEGKEVLTYDFPNVPKIDLAGVANGVYNIRVKFSTDSDYGYLYCDEILLVVDGGKDSLQLLPTYGRGVASAGSSTWYSGYRTDKLAVRPAITQADVYKQ